MQEDVAVKEVLDKCCRWKKGFSLVRALCPLPNISPFLIYLPHPSPLQMPPLPTSLHSPETHL